MPLMWSLNNFKYIKTMKNFNLFKSLLIMLCMVLMGGGSVKAETVVTFTAPEGWTTTGGAQSFMKSGVTISTNQGAANINYKDYRIYSGKTFSISSKNGKISKVVLTCSSGNGPEYLKDATVGNFTYEGNVGTWTGSAESFSLSAIGKQVRMTEIVVTLEASDKPSILLDQSSVSFGEVDQNSEVSPKSLLVTLNNLTSASVAISGEGASAFEVSPSTLTETGNITITPKTTTVGTYEATLTVSAVEATSQTATISMTVVTPFEGSIWEVVPDDLKSNGGTGYDAYKGVQTKGDINYYIENVMPNSGNIQFKSSSGYLYNQTSFYEIKKVVLTTTSTAITMYAGSSENPSETEVTGTQKEDKIVYEFSEKCGYFKIFNGNETTKISKIAVYYIVDPSFVDKPTLSLAEGTYWTDQTLTIDVPSGVDGVKYTTDGSDPKTSKTTNTYSTPINITETTTVRAIAFKGENYSEEVSRTYTFVPSIANTKETAYTTAKAIDIIESTSAEQLAAEKVYVKGIVSEIVTPYSTQYGNITFNISADGTTTGDQFQFYRTKNQLNGVAYNPGIEKGREVVGYGELYKHESTYEFKANNYLVSYTGSNKNATLVAQQGGYYYATFSSENPVKFEDAEVYAVNVSGDALVLNSVESKLVPANTGVLIKSTAEGISYYATLCSDEDKIENNLLKASSVTMSASDKNYKLAYNDYTNKTGLGFYYGAADGGVFTAKEGGAYLAVPSSPTPARCFTFDDVETGINFIEVADEANTAAEVYDLAGRKVSKAQKGLYIVNGVKVIK